MEQVATPKRFHHKLDSQGFSITKQLTMHKHKGSMPSLITLHSLTSPKNFYGDEALSLEIENILREIDPNFQFSHSKRARPDQIIQCLKQAAEFIISSFKKTQDLSVASIETIPCEFCGKASKTIKTQNKKLQSQSQKIKKRLKSFEKAKLIQNTKIKEEKNIINSIKTKLEVLTEELDAKNKMLANDEKKSKSLKFSIEPQMSIDTLPLKKMGKLSLAKFSVFSIENSLDFTSLVEELNSQISMYNSEIAIKENSINSREAMLSIKESRVEKYLNDIELMNLSLNNSKNELNELQIDVMPALEIQSELLHQLIDDLHQKKTEIEDYLKGLSSNALNPILLEAEKIKAEALKKYNENCKFAESLLRTQKDLDNYYAGKNKELKENSEQLVRLQKDADITIDLITKKEKELLHMSEILKEKEKLVNLKIKSSDGSLASTPDLAENCNLKNKKKAMFSYISH